MMSIVAKALKSDCMEYVLLTILHKALTACLPQVADGHRN